MTAVFVDTNVLVYASDVRDFSKHGFANDVLAVLGDHRICISTQVLAEYANVVTHDSKLALPASLAAEAVKRMALAWRVLPVDAATVATALEARGRWQLPYYDAQIWASAARAAVRVVVSEDFADGAELAGVRFVNPFADGFDVEAL